ncbi:MAG TPA: protein translocase subunit SecF [Actinophytocola sp.]|uniref:protein translocase subunit SecF n=1 Tax=Actinophytocola sp. TaxID=1872138 RepID=UPI002DB81C1D|nr:protein translocase subunit SecF [Actinophytocola sp.]HEU5472855.1 protein translocase subunit SecF [Actinophytocola sp.]
MTEAPTKKPTSTRTPFFTRLYTGTGAFDIVGKRKRWYVMFGVLMLICIGSIIFRGFHLGIEFEGGTKLQLPARNAAGPITTEQVTDVFSETLGRDPASVQLVGTGETTSIQVKSEALNVGDVVRVNQALVEQLNPIAADGDTGSDVISDSAVSGSWGGEISRQALIALGVFLVLVTIFLAMYFERWMAVAALTALIHDVVITSGLYSLVGFEVTPATVIGLLTILGFSLYDTVVVFDKVKENTRGLLGLTRRTYGEAANLALNQTLMRSINTSLIALLPVVGLMVVGVGLLGVGTLKDLALVQLTGMTIGAMSSIFLATPLLVDLKMRDPRFQQQAARVRNRRENLARKAAEREAAVAVTGEPIAVDLSDDETLESELRQEKAMAAASSVPARNPKAADAKRGRPAGKAAGARPSRPTGKKRR